MNVFYTTIFNKRDILRTPKVFDADFEYVVFTDDKQLKSDFWNIIYVDLECCPRKSARMYKLLPHKYFPGHNLSIWSDACFNQIKSVEDLKNINIGMYHNPFYTNIYQVIVNNIDRRYDWKFNINKHYIKYKKEKFPEEYPVYETGFLVRKNTNLMIQFNELWWQELNYGSVRDQISLPYVLWKLKIEVKALGNDVRNSEYLDFNAHPLSDKIQPKI